MKIVVVGDVHGNLKEMYQKASDLDADLVLQLGDFQAIRNPIDLRQASIPEKHKKLGDFPYLYNQGKVPIPTYFIGGNHENNRWLSQYPNGEELIKNLHYLGRSGVRQIAGLSIAWVSGNYSLNAFSRTSRKKPRYHHFTQEDIGRVATEQNPIDILLLHDWPLIEGLEQHLNGELANTVAIEDAKKRRFGNQEHYRLVTQSKPKYVFAGHMHIRLDLKLSIGDSPVRFISLGRVEDENSTYVLNIDESGKS